MREKEIKPPNMNHIRTSYFNPFYKQY